MIEEKKMVVDGNPVSFIAGPREPNRANILFIHSAGSTGLLWRDEVEHFAKSCNTISLDLPGRRGSGAKGREDAFSYADFVKGVMDGAGYVPAVVVGLSMGGAVAQALALDHPDAVRGLVLSGTGAKMPVAPAIFEGIERDYDFYLEMSKKMAYGPDASGEVRERIGRIAADVKPKTAYGDFVTCNTFDSRKRLFEIKVPTLILCGDVDYLMPLKFSTYLHENIDGSRLEVFPGVGHIVMAEVPERFRELVREFIDGL
jgi:pimeloyl-ACP methyl ester carboxylesterase